MSYQVGDTIFFKYGNCDVATARVSKINKKSITLCDFIGISETRLKDNKLIDSIVKGFNDHYTLHTIDIIKYSNRKKYKQITKQFTDYFGGFQYDISIDKKEAIIKILES